jgi:uncharacterized phage protein (TIGR01671 family)
VDCQFVEKEWHYGWLFRADNLEEDFVIRYKEKHANGREYYKNRHVNPDTIGQFSGVLDENGKEIYEGDFVEWEDIVGNRRIDKVAWSNGGLCLCNSQYAVGHYSDSKLKVLGNIHDNPELEA